MERDIRDALVGRLGIEDNTTVRRALIEELAPIASEDEGVATALKVLYQSNADEDTKLRTLGALRNVYPLDAEVRAIFEAELLTQGGSEPPVVVKEVIGERVSAGDSDAVSAVPAAFRGGHPNTRNWAEEIAKQLMRKGQLDIRQKLLDQLRAEDPGQRA